MDRRSNIYKTIAIIFILSGVLFVSFLNKEYLNLNMIKCNLKKGDYSNGKCLILNLTSFKKYLSNIKINISDEQINKNKKIKINLLDNKIVEIDNIFTTVIPYIVTQNNIDYYYLGLFRTARNRKKYFNGIKHIDSYFLGENIKLGKLKSEKGLYINILTQEYLQKGERKKIKLRVSEVLNKFYLNKNCEEIGKKVEKIRGDGQKYIVCILNENKMCELKSYQHGNCPFNGFNVSTLSEKQAYCLLTGNNPWSDTCNIIGRDVKCDFDDYFKGKCK